MAYQDLREFVRALEKNNELKRIPFEVDPRLEITEFADRAVKKAGPALLFERPTGYNVPVLINAFASMRKMEIALEVKSVEEVAQRIVEFLEMRMPEGIIGKLKMLPKLAEMGAFFPKIVSKGPCQEVVRTDGFSPLDYPVLQCWPEDGGRFITLPLVFSRNPDTGKRNCGMYRMQVTTGHRGMHCRPTNRARNTIAACSSMTTHGCRRSDRRRPAAMYSAILPLRPTSTK
jgi:4-hydroxy-3-polyprenylbenzoate decarboxylase